MVRISGHFDQTRDNPYSRTLALQVVLADWQCALLSMLAQLIVCSFLHLCIFLNLLATFSRLFYYSRLNFTLYYGKMKTYYTVL